MDTEQDRKQPHCGVKSKTSEKSYSNLMFHIQTAHLRLENVTVSFYSPKCSRISPCMKLIVTALLPFSFVSKIKIARFFHDKSISVHIFKHNLHKLMKCFEYKIGKKLPNKFSILFDACTGPSTHFVAFYYCFRTNNILGYDYCLLSFGPFEDGSKLGTDELDENISFTKSHDHRRKLRFE